MTNDISSVLDYYARNGAALLYINAGEKVPKYDNWHDFTSRDPAQWQAWINAGLNIGVHSGNSNWIVVDGDTKSGPAFERWCQLCRDHGDDAGKYPAQVRSRSGGFHIYFRAPDGIKLTRRTPVPDVELRAGSHQTVVPPSQVEGLPYAFYANPQPPFDAPQWMVDICREAETPAAHAEIKTFDLADIRDRCRFLVTKRRFDVENDWVNSVWAIKRAFGESGWPIAIDISDIDFKGRLENTWGREGKGKGKPVTCATLIEWSNELGYREWKREHLFAGVTGAQQPFVDPEIGKLYSAREMMTRTFAPVRKIVPGYLVAGLTIIGGKSKVGKSWWALDCASAVAGSNAGRFMGIPVEQGDALVLALEDSHARMTDRLRKVIGPFHQGPARMTYATKWPRGQEGVDKIREWIKSVPNPALVVIDVFAKFRGAPVKGQSAYDRDYADAAPLQALAVEHNIAVLVVHHLRKGAQDDDPFDTLSGTMGLSGAADSTLILRREGEGAVLYGRGRDIEEVETAVVFERYRWHVLGDAYEHKTTKERAAIIAEMRSAAEPMTASGIAEAVGKSRTSVANMLRKMRKDGVIRKDGTRYALCDTGDTGDTDDRRDTSDAVTPPVRLVAVNGLPPPPY